MNAERQRLRESAEGRVPWMRWGPYVSERQWGCVREDYSADGDAWAYFTHEQSRSRAYRWGEDGIAGFSDDKQRLCLTLALWNGRDPILKERLFGLANNEGNHGEDVKELYNYLDATPTHSYLKMLYRYPQAEFPYQQLLDENRKRDKNQEEYDLPDTGIFDGGRWFDVVVEYAKADAADILMNITVHNRGPARATIHLLPQLTSRNNWSWKDGSPRPRFQLGTDGSILIQPQEMVEMECFIEGTATPLFTENETNEKKLFGTPNPSPYCKDAFHERVVHGTQAAVNPQNVGTKAAFWQTREIDGGASIQVRLRLRPASMKTAPFTDFESILNGRRGEAEEFYGEFQSEIRDPLWRLVQRQAFAGLIWTKQFYRYDVRRWLEGDPNQPSPPAARLHGRNHLWSHLNCSEVISMPDKWEYPWFASWDLAFHCIPFAMVDPEFAKRQLTLLTHEWFMHPNGQLPAYEWEFGDVNPPVQAWAAWRVFQMDRKQNGGDGDLAFLEGMLHKLMLNFTWWVNRKDALGHNIFQGGFLGLDNIGVFDRSKPLPTGGFISQADGTSWMAMYSLNLLRIALELALHNPVYEGIATKFFEHFLSIAQAMSGMGREGTGLWHEADGFYYDALNLPDGTVKPLEIRSMVGLIPLFAVETLEPEMLERLPKFRERMEWVLENRPDLASLVSRWDEPGRGQRHLLSLLRGHRMKCLLRRMLDESEFLSTYGVRALSRYHLEHPFELPVNGGTLRVSYEPGESKSGMFGGNSNWRGPIWTPVNYLIIESLQRFHHYYGDDFKIECPVGSGKMVSLREAGDEIACRLMKLYVPDEKGRRPCDAGQFGSRAAELSGEYLYFYEYFHGDTGRGLGASHQTGWTALLAKMIQPRRSTPGTED